MTTLHESGRLVSDKADVVFVLPHMGRGGAQRVVSLVANAWARQGRRIAVLTWIDGRDEAHSLDSVIMRLRLADYIQAEEKRMPWRLWWRFRSRARQFERWMRPKLPFRGLRWSLKAPRQVPLPSADQDSLPTRKVPWFRNRVARILIAIDRRIHGATSPQNQAAIGLRSLLSSAVKWLLPRSAAFQSAATRLALDRRVAAFRRALIELEAPVVVSLLTRTNIYVLEAARALPCRVVISERNDPDLQEIDPVWQILRTVSYRRATAVTANAAGVLRKLESYVPTNKLQLLPNPILVPAAPERPVERGRRFITVTRLVHQKGIDLLLRAFAEVASELPDWSVEVVGDGPLRKDLVSLSRQLGIGRRVKFHGYLQDPIDTVRAARVFVLPSRFEGMPNSLLEAMACGLAPIVSNSSPGPLECVIDRESGLVVPSENVEYLAAAMKTLANDDALTDRLGRQAAVFIEQHDWSVVEPRWLEVLGIPRGPDVSASPRRQARA